MRSVVLEGFVVGLLASVLGLLAGLGIAKGMSALFASLGVDLPETGTVLAPRTIIVSLLTGTLVTLVASIVPALRATRVPPISAVREGSAATAAPGSPRAGPRLLVSGACPGPDRARRCSAASLIALTLVSASWRCSSASPCSPRRSSSRCANRARVGAPAATGRSRGRTPSATRAARPPRPPR